LDKNYEVGLVKLDGTIEINNKINVNYSNNKFYYVISGIDQNNTQLMKKNPTQ
jgi:hypothetical protein